jgi:DNA repair exonuclease SbcCD nuclease subunit
MKIVHLSDTHLGYMGQGLQRFVSVPWLPNIPVRQQAADIVAAFTSAIDRIITTIQPDLVIHSGDVFDNARPTAHMVDLAMTQLRRLSDAGIQTIIIEGNHSYPRDRSNGSILKLLSHVPHVTVVCDEVARIRYGTVLLHAVPHRAALHGFGPVSEDIDPTASNVLIAHGVADGDIFFQSGRAVVDLPIQEIADWFAYIALGHCHRFAQVTGTRHAFYAGSLAMVTWRDFRPCHSFGFNIVTISRDEVQVHRELLPTRPMRPYGLDDARGLSAGEVLTLLERQTRALSPNDAYCHVLVEGLDPLARRELTHRQVEEIFETAAGRAISLRAREQHWETIREGLVEGGTLDARLVQLVSQLDLDATLAAEVQALGQELLQRAFARVSDDDVHGVDAEEDAP